MRSVLSRPLIAATCVLALLAVSCGTSHQADWSAQEPTGTVADLGFRPEVDGYGFTNFTRVYNADLDEEDIKDLLGPLACEEEDAEEVCTLTRGAAAFRSVNQDLARGGVCEGMAVTSLLFFDGKLDPAEYGGGEVSELTIEDNPGLEREIRKWNATQLTVETQQSLVRGDTMETLDELTRAFREGDELYSLGIYNRVDGDLVQGHAVVPYRIDHVGDGTVEVAIYNPDFPGEESSIVIDAAEGTWSYEGASVFYDGGGSLELAPMSARDVDQFESSRFEVTDGEEGGCNVRGSAVG